MSLYLNRFNFHTLRMVRSAKPTAVSSTSSAELSALCLKLCDIFKAQVKLLGNNFCIEAQQQQQQQHPHQQHRASAAFTAARKTLSSLPQVGKTTTFIM